MDSQTLVLVGEDPDTYDYSLIKLDISTQDSSLCLDENGNEIIITEEPLVFVMYPKPDGSMIAMLAGEIFHIAYPIIVDLKTGKIHHIYGYSLESSSHEYCDFCNLSWYELK